MSHRIRINHDGTVYWHGVDAGKTKVLAMNEDKGLIVLHTAGSYWWDNGGKHYDEAKITVHEYHETVHGYEYDLLELFGVMEFAPRGNKWEPKQ